jgi:hypothetical protein
MAARWLKSLTTGVVVLGAATLAAPAAGRVDGSSPYTKAQTYSGALRYVRVGLGYEVVEKDPEAAYLIFRYTPPGANKDGSVTGTLEVVEASGGVRVFVNLPRMPEYHERLLRDGLLKKLRDEYGAPRPVEKKPPTPAPDDKTPSDKPTPPAEGS